MPSLFDLFNRFRKQLVSLTASDRSSTQVEARLSSQYRGSETDNTFYPGNNMSGMYRNRYDYDRQTIFAECLRAWRTNPLARRIVKLISMFIVGAGIEIKSDNKHTDKYLQDCRPHRAPNVPICVLIDDSARLDLPSCHNFARETPRDIFFHYLPPILAGPGPAC